MRRSIVALVALVLSVAVLSASAAAAQATRGQPEKEVPLTIELASSMTARELAPGFPDEQSTFDGRCDTPSDWIWHEHGTGRASHLGTVTYTLWHCTQGGPSTYEGGEMVITAANGDSLSLVHSGSFAFEGGVSVADGVAEIVGGTGRFAGASGEVSETAIFDFATMSQTMDAFGSIAYDASSRSGR